MDITQIFSSPLSLEKDRLTGLTVVNDKGLSINSIKDITATSAQLISYVSLHQAALSSAESLKERVELYKQAGIIPFISGTVFEAAYSQGKTEEYLNLLKINTINHVEISDGIIEINPTEKTEIISELSKHFTVFVKVGAKINNAIYPISKWKDDIELARRAGAKKIIIESGESGISQTISGKIEMKENVVNRILELQESENIIWDAPLPQQQIWLINHIGAHVGLAGINPHDVLNTASQRLGIFWDLLEKPNSKSIFKAKLRKTHPFLDIDFQI